MEEKAPEIIRIKKVFGSICSPTIHMKKLGESNLTWGYSDPLMN